MSPRHLIFAAALIAVLMLAFFLWPQTPGHIAEEPVSDGGGAGTAAP